MTSHRSDVVIIGAGAAGLMCAIEAGKRGRRVTVLDHARRPAEKIRISGGGRCNFTNLHTSPENFVSANPRFCISALSRYRPEDFIRLVQQHNIGFHEKARGQLFCDDSSSQIIRMLLDECRATEVQLHLQAQVESIDKVGSLFHIRAAREGAPNEFMSESLVIASGGLSIPKMGASGFGYEIARRFDIGIIPTEPALVPITFSEKQLEQWSILSGVSLESTVRSGKRTIHDSLLFTHRGLSGPAILQISLYTQPGQSLRVNLSPSQPVAIALQQAKSLTPHMTVAGVLGTALPKRLANRLVEVHLPQQSSSRLGELTDRRLQQLGAAINDWCFVPNGTEGYRTAEVTLGGIDTAELSSQTMEARKVPGLFFIGEVVDVTGQLGGFNFQWAWASGFVAGQYA